MHKLLKIEKRLPKQYEELKKQLTTVKDWHHKKASVNILGFQRLYQILEENLDDLRVVRIGKVEIEIYVVGFDTKDILANFMMKAVET